MPIEQTMTYAGPTSHSFTSQRMRLHYVDWGNKGKPPLLLVHGGRDHCRSWDWVAEALCEDWHVIALDHRGHGDSEWVSDGTYLASDMVYDLAQLVHQLDLAPVTIVSHSMGGNVSLRYAGAFPEQVRKLVAIEGLGPSPKLRQEMLKPPYPERVRDWVEKKRDAAARLPRRYATMEDAIARMHEANRFLSHEQAIHLTIHGVNRNEDGTFTWKFDPYLNLWPAEQTSAEDEQQSWAAITCPTLLMYGAESWASNPEKDGRIAPFRNAEVVVVDKAGHWLHHDQYPTFMRHLREFL